VTKYTGKASKHKTARERGRYSVSDGRHAVGSVREVAGGFVAITITGIVVGTFGSLRKAAAALPNGGAQ
jgi:hypothetical protein